MRMKLGALTLALLMALGCAGMARAGQITGINILNWGLAEIKLTGQTVQDKYTAEGSWERAKLVKMTKAKVIPAKAGVSFGVEYELVGQPADGTGSFMVRVLNPLLKVPGSTQPVNSQDVVFTRKLNQRHFFAYEFENDWEMVPGTWTFQFLYEGTLMAEHSFKVVKP